VKKIISVLTATVLVCSLAACEGKSKSQADGQALTEQAFEQQSKAVPYPADQLKDSLERRNIRERLLRTNDPAKIGYVYVLSFSKPLGYYVIKGKVTSTQSQMTTEDLIVKPCDGCDRYTVAGPGDDGSYGANEPGIFFFTTEGAMVTTDLDYIYSDQPIPFDVPKLNKS
jgi:hypothetical protein